MDCGNFSNSAWLTPPGVSGWPASPHYSDSYDDFLEGKLHKWHWEDADIRRAAVTELKLTPDNVKSCIYKHSQEFPIDFVPDENLRENMQSIF